MYFHYVFEHRYGSPKEPIKEALRNGLDTLFDIDWQGTQQLEYAFRTDLVRIFILPPSVTKLEQRGDVLAVRIRQRFLRQPCQIGLESRLELHERIRVRQPLQLATQQLQRGPRQLVLPRRSGTAALDDFHRFLHGHIAGCRGGNGGGANRASGTWPSQTALCTGLLTV